MGAHLGLDDMESCPEGRDDFLAILDQGEPGMRRKEEVGDLPGVAVPPVEGAPLGGSPLGGQRQLVVPASLDVLEAGRVLLQLVGQQLQLEPLVAFAHQWQLRLLGEDGHLEQVDVAAVVGGDTLQVQLVGLGAVLPQPQQGVVGAQSLTLSATDVPAST